MPRDTLTRDEIVDAAIRLLDAEGLEGLNMRSLGARLDSAATAVYWHVGSKENLVALASDKVWNELALPAVTARRWRAAATAMATELHAMLVRHAWLLQAFGSFLVFGRGKARHDDHLLAIFEAAGFRGAEADQAATALFTFVLGNALGPAAAASLARKLGDASDEMRDRMAMAREIATQFPRLRSRLKTAAAAHGVSPAASFELGLDAILDGLAARLRRRG